MIRIVTAAALSLLAAGFASNARAEDISTQHLLSVSGHGEARQRPDIVAIVAGVTARADTASAALGANSANMQSVMKTLKDSGIADKDIQTSNFTVQPQYDYSDTARPQFLGYEVQNTVTVALRDVTKLGGLLDRLVKSGANQINSITFDVADPVAALDEARIQAVADARHKAEVFATASGIALGQIVSLSEAAANAPPVAVRATADKASYAGDVPVAEGEHVVAVDINMSWQIK